MTDHDSKTDAVQALFGGRMTTMRLPKAPHDVASLEAAIGSPFLAFTRFRAGAWTITDVRMVLSHAFPGARLRHKLTRVDAVEAALKAEPIATYAPLAVMLLEAMLFGLDVDKAIFSERGDA